MSTKKGVGPLPDCQWNPEKLSLSEYLERFKGPEVVRLSTPDGSGVRLGPPVDGDRPFFVYSHRRRTKVYAEAVTKQKDNYVRKGPLFEIPKDYVGWFEIIPKSGRSPGHYATIGALAGSNCKYFLTRTTLCGFRVTEDEAGEIQLGEEQTLYPGEVLQAQKICKKQWKVTKEKQANGKHVPQTQFLKCKDLKKNQICLPLAHPGKFSVIADKTTRDINVVYQIWNVLDNYPLPVIVKLAFGWAPTGGVGAFEGTLRLVQSTRPDSFIMYSFTGDGCILLELPLDANIKVQTASNQKDLEKSKAFRHAKQFCERRVFPFAISLKALALPYETVPSSEEEEKVPLSRGHMAPPRDMNLFNRSDVYPPLEDGHVADTWSFSFKDPDFMSDAELLELEKQGESRDDISTVQLRAHQSSRDSRGQARAVSRVSTAGYDTNQTTTKAQVHRKSTDARGEKLQQIKEREAPC